jgi:hypothetical protein
VTQFQLDSSGELLYNMTCIVNGMLRSEIHWVQVYTLQKTTHLKGCMF